MLHVSKVWNTFASVKDMGAYITEDNNKLQTISYCCFWQLQTKKHGRCKEKISYGTKSIYLWCLCDGYQCCTKGRRWAHWKVSVDSSLFPVITPSATLSDSKLAAEFPRTFFQACLAWAWGCRLRKKKSSVRAPTEPPLNATDAQVWLEWSHISFLWTMGTETCATEEKRGVYRGSWQLLLNGK